MKESIQTQRIKRLQLICISHFSMMSRSWKKVSATSAKDKNSCNHTRLLVLTHREGTLVLQVLCLESSNTMQLSCLDTEAFYSWGFKDTAGWRWARKRCLLSIKTDISAYLWLMSSLTFFITLVPKLRTTWRKSQYTWGLTLMLFLQSYGKPARHSEPSVLLMKQLSIT